MRPLAAVDDVAIQFPSLKIVICHLGYYRYEETCYLVAKHPNVYADISWLCGIAGLEKPTVGVVTSPQVDYPVFHLLGTTATRRPAIWWPSTPTCTPTSPGCAA